VREVPSEETSRFGIVNTDEGGRIVEFYEKPSEFKGTLASMGVYVFNTEFLLDTLEQDANDPESEHDFGRNIIPVMLEKHAVYAYTFEDFWVDVGTLPIYWLTSLDLLSATPPLDLYDHRWTIHTRSEERPPVKLAEGARVEGSLLSNGCVIAGAVVNSVLSPGVIVEAGAEVRDSIVMNDTVISSGARIDRCILDKQIVVGADAALGYGDDNTPNETEPQNLQSGITIVGKDAHIPEGTRVGRNCRIDPNVREHNFGGREVRSGQTILVSEA
jgi:glucose-1-phosphate adenylyltransferase